MTDTSPVLTAIRARRSLRQYTPQPVTQEVILQLLTAAVWAPSAHNRQPWRFAVVEASAEKEHVARIMGERLRADLAADGVAEPTILADTGRSYQRITSAPVLILLCLSMVDMDDYPDERRRSLEHLMAVQSTAMAGQNLLLAAHALGLGACWMCAPLFCAQAVREVLNLPEDWEPQGLITVGYPAQEREKTRDPLESSVVWR